METIGSIAWLQGQIASLERQQEQAKEAWTRAEGALQLARLQLGAKLREEDEAKKEAAPANGELAGVAHLD